MVAINFSAKQYLKELIKYAKPRGLISAYIAGSALSKTYSKKSDVDVLLVMKDEISNFDLKQMRKEIRKLEIKYSYRKTTKKFLHKIPNFLCDKITVSCILWREKDVMNNDMSKMSEATLIGNLLMPTALIHNSVFSKLKLVYGKNIKFHESPKITYFELLKNFIVNFGLAIIAFPLALITKNYSKFSTTAIKWTIHGCTTFQGVTKIHDLRQLIEKCFGNELQRNYVKRLFEIRKNGKGNLLFSLQTVWYVVKLHFIVFFKKHA